MTRRRFFAGKINLFILGALTSTLAIANVEPSEAASNGTQSSIHATIQKSINNGHPVFISKPAMNLPGFALSNKDLRWHTVEHLLKAELSHLYGLNDSLYQIRAKTHSDNAGVHILRYQQMIDGIEVFDGSVNVIAFDSGEVSALSGTFYPFTLEKPHAKDLQSLSSRFSKARNLTLPFIALEETSSGWFQDPNDENGSLRAKPIYVLREKQLSPAWQVEAYSRKGQRNELTQYILTENGEIIRQNSLTKDVAFNYRAYGDNSGEFRPFDSPFGNAGTPFTGAKSDPLPAVNTAPLLTIEEVSDLRNDPWLPISASTLTGNNVDVYLDVDSIDGFSAGDRRATLSSSLSFDYSLTPANSVNDITNQNAAMVHAFYVANWMHDVFYDAGFNEATFNAQENNFGRGGAQSDRLLIEVQDVEDRNNANISVPSDGNSPRMQVFLWDGQSTHSAQVANNTFQTGAASFGPTNFSITGELVLMLDSGGTSTTDGCEDLTNASALSGKIALVDRGNCNFIDKVIRAESAGAIAVLVANHSPGVLTMGKPDETTTEPTIGSLIVSKADGDAVKIAVNAGTVNATLNRSTGGDVDGAFDSSLVAHEWGHLLVNRLMSVGGAEQSNGIDEGWSDVIALMTIVRPEDIATNFSGGYGFSSYAGSDMYYGIRRLPYSSDFAKNALTFRHISNGQALPLENQPKFGAGGTNNAEVHATGEVWASMIWEGYSQMLRTHSFADAQTRMRAYMVNGLIAVSGSSPTFTMARDALLSVITDPTDLQIFRDAFARRGLGVNAISPSITDDTNSNAVESFTWTATQKPVVSVSANQSVNEGSLVTVSATATDSDGSIASTQWKQVTGQLITLSSTSDLSTSFTAPSVTTSDVITLRFTATDNAGEKADADIQITVNGNNQSPTANAGNDQTVTEGATVTLNAAASSDSDGTIVSFTWSKIAGPDITFTPSAAGPSVQFLAPQVDVNTTIDIRVTVVDNDGLSATDDVRINVNNGSAGGNGGGSSGGGGSLPITFALVSLLALCRARRIS